jgi:NAD(P)-dependent dehydrogenase (short-subunit alcohol dehydrogenase family)
MSLQDKVCLITGGAAGIGRATAELFAARGAIVAFCDLNDEAGEALANELGDTAVYHHVNVTDRQAVQDWVEGVERHTAVSTSSSTTPASPATPNWSRSKRANWWARWKKPPSTR